MGLIRQNVHVCDFLHVGRHVNVLGFVFSGYKPFRIAGEAPVIRSSLSSVLPRQSAPAAGTEPAPPATPYSPLSVFVFGALHLCTQASNWA